MRTLLSADQANQTPPDTLGEYTERVLNYNVDARRKQLKRTQKSLMQPMGVTSEGAVSQRLKGITHWSLISAVNVAQSLDTSIEKLLDDSAMKMEIERQAVALRVQLDQINQMTGNKKATGDTPVASGELLRLGLNQRPFISIVNALIYQTDQRCKRKLRLHTAVLAEHRNHPHRDTPLIV